MRNLFFIIILLSSSNIIISQTGFEIIVDTEQRSLVSSSILDKFNNAILCGVEKNLENQKRNAFVVKISPTGDSITKFFNHSNDSISALLEIIELDSNQYIFFGGIGVLNTSAIYEDFDYIWVVKLDEYLQVIWDKRYELPENYWGPSFEVFHNGNGEIYGIGDVDWWDGYHRVHLFLAKFNLDGDTLQTRFPFINDPYQYPIGVIEGGSMGRADGQPGIVTIGDGFMAGLEEGIVEVDSNLNYTFDLLPYPPYISGHYDSPCVVRLSPDSYVLSAGIYHEPSDNHNMAVVKFNGSNQIEESVFYGRQDTSDHPAIFKSIDFTDPNKIFVASRNNNFTTDPLNTWVSVALFDSSLNMAGIKWYGGDKNYYISAISATLDGGCIIGGTVYDWQNGNYHDVDVWIKKVFAEDIITNAEETPDPTDSDIVVYPNPGRHYIHIYTARKNLEFKLFNTNGIQVLSKRIVQFPQEEIDASKLTKGNYPYQVWDHNKNLMIESGIWIKN